MNRRNWSLGAALTVGIWLGCVCGAIAQSQSVAGSSPFEAARAAWRNRMLRVSSPHEGAWLPSRGVVSVPTAIQSGQVDSAGPELFEEIPPGVIVEQYPSGEGGVSGEPFLTYDSEPILSNGCSAGGGCGGGAGCDGGCGPSPCNPCEPCASCLGCGRHPWFRGHVGWLLRRTEWSMGVHGFQGPVDLGASGNFGMNFGVNFSAPMGGPWGLGYQLGARTTHSDFAGNRTLGVPDASRDQLFLTAGIFRRQPTRGFQWGVVFDFFHDNYYATADTRQIRAELGWVGRRGNELGFRGAFGVAGSRFVPTLYDQPLAMPVSPTDQFQIYHRRHLASGGTAEGYIGMTGLGDGLIGASCTMPLGRSLAMRSGFDYLLPTQGKNTGGPSEESWNLSLSLLWYPGRQSACAINSPFRPAFSVADNGSFHIDRR